MRLVWLPLVLTTTACFVDYVGEPEGTGSGSGGTGASTGKGTSSPSSSTGDPGPEGNCFDGLDGEADGLVDCADPDCSDVARCVEIPAGWALVAIELTAPNAAPQGSCDTTPEVRHTDPDTTPACSSCGCTETQAATCSAPEISCWYTSTSCSGTPSYQAALPAGCTSSNLPGIPGGGQSAGACRLTGVATPIAPPVCAFTGGALTPEPMFGGDAHVCSSIATSMCGGSEACIPLGHPAGEVCIRHAGQHTCPTGWDAALTIFASGADSRGCEPCSCSATCSGGGYIVHDSAGCTTYHPDVSVMTSNCTATPDIWDYTDGTLFATAGTPSAPTCGGGAPVGLVTGEGEETVCCVP